MYWSHKHHNNTILHKINNCGFANIMATRSTIECISIENNEIIHCITITTTITNTHTYKSHIYPNKLWSLMLDTIVSINRLALIN